MNLRILTGPRRDEDIELPSRGPFSIGRDSSCDLWIDDPKISRAHCSLDLRGGEWVLIDGGSANGTWVDGDKVNEIALGHGATVTLGDTAFELFDPRFDVPAETFVEESETFDEDPGRPARSRRPGTGLSVGPVVGLLAVCAVIGFLLTRGSDPEGSGEPTESEGRSSIRTRGERVATATDTRPSESIDAESSQGDAGSGGGDLEPVAKDDDLDNEELEPEPRERRRSSGEERVADLREETLPRLLKNRDYKRALSTIEYVQETTPDFLGGKERAEVLAHARAYLDETLREVEKLVAANQVDDARELGLDRLLLFPKELADELSVALHEMRAAAETRLDREQQRERIAASLEISALRAISALDFSSASEHVAALRADEEFDRDRLVVVARYVDLASRVWRSIESGLSARVGKTSKVTLAFEPERDIVELRSSGGFHVAKGLVKSSYRVLFFEGGFLDVVSVDGRRVLFDIFASSDAALRTWSRRKTADLNANDRDEALALLLLLREGPGRATRFIGSTKLDAAASDRLNDLARAHRDLWALERRKRLRKRREFVETKAESVPADWIRVAASYAELGRLWRARNDFDAVRPQLERSFREARIEHLRREPPRKTFRAKSIDWIGDRLRLAYDFSDDQQLGDLRAIGAGSSFVRRGGVLAVRGEIRFFRANPFTGRLSVVVRCASGGFDPARPNLSVALWTFADDVVAPKKSMSLTKAMSADPPRFADYLVFGYGYYNAPFDFGGTPLYQVRPLGAGEEVQLPANVIFIGRHGQSLHEASGECAWAEKLRRRATGSLEIRIEAGEGLLRWEIDRRAVIKKPTSVLKPYVESIDRLGSVSLLTGKREALIRSVEIEGRLDPIWLADLFQSSVNKELDRLFD